MKKTTLTKLRDVRTGKPLKITARKLPLGFRAAARKAGREMRAMLELPARRSAQQEG